MKTPLFLYAKKIRLPSASANILQSLNMAAAFAETAHGCRAYVGCGEDPAVLHHALDSIGLQYLPLGWRMIRSASKRGYGMRFRVGLLQSLLHPGPVIAYARDIGEASTLAFLRRVRRFTLVYEAHEVLHLMHRAAGRKEWEATKRHEAGILAAVSGVVVTSERVAQELRDALGYSGPLLVAPNGYNPHLFYPIPLFTEASPWPGATDPVQLVYVGNFHPGKGMEELIAAMGLLPERFHLKIIGGNPPDVFDKIREQAQQLAPGRVTFCGALPQSKIREACVGAHMFVIPQQSEFYFSPLKLYEAFALGIPVLTTPLEVFRSFARGDVVCLADGTTPLALASSVQQLTDSPERAAALRQNALAEAGDKTWSVRSRRIISFTACR